MAKMWQKSELLAIFVTYLLSFRQGTCTISVVLGISHSTRLLRLNLWCIWQAALLLLLQRHPQHECKLYFGNPLAESEMHVVEELRAKGIEVACIAQRAHCLLREYLFREPGPPHTKSIAKS